MFRGLCCLQGTEMRLLTHNMLSSNIKGVTNGFPLRIEVEKMVEKQVDFNADFLKNMFTKIEWKALFDAAQTMGYTDLPAEAESSMLDSDEFLKKFHHALLELHLEEGALICPETGRRFPVNKGIPNMLLHEDEVWVRSISISLVPSSVCLKWRLGIFMKGFKRKLHIRLFWPKYFVLTVKGRNGVASLLLHGRYLLTDWVRGCLKQEEYAYMIWGISGEFLLKHCFSCRRVWMMSLKMVFCFLELKNSF